VFATDNSVRQYTFGGGGQVLHRRPK
jgi:hypothetical protein